MKLLAWNIRHGGGSTRMPMIALRLLEHDADVVVITEYRRTTGGQIAGVLADHGLRHQICSDPPAGKNGLLLAARTPILPEPDLTHRWAEVLLPESGLRIAAVHVPHDSPGQPTASTARTRFFKSLVATARRHAAEPFVLLGDFNAGRRHADEEGATLTCAYYLGVLASLGYVDAWRRFNPDSREYSWISPLGGGYRIDHAFVSRPLAERLRSCRYFHEDRQRGLSDHSAMSVCLD